MLLNINRQVNFCLVLFLLITNVNSFSQEMPPIQVFSSQDYGAENQNWAISQADNDFIYVANNKGLLEYNGASWQLYNSPNDGILRSVRVVGDKIFSGGYMDFGYWLKDDFGGFQYTSLAENKNFSIKEDEDFWGIIDVEGYVIFQSFDRIYIYNTTDLSFDIIESDERINKVFKVGQSIYFQKMDVGVFEIRNGKANVIISSEAIKGKELVNIYDFDNGLLLQTKEHGFYTFQNNSVNRWSTEIDDLLSNISIYSSISLREGGFILGTIANGIIQLDKNGKQLLKIDQSYGLSNNTILSLLEDNFGNIWLGLDNGINVVNLNSPFKVYTDKQGVLGTVYAAAQTHDFLYLGTNQGLFYKPINTNVKFKFIEGTKGQVWSLSFLKGTLFCGHDKGTFVINNFVAQKVSSEIGTWAVKEIVGRPNLLIQGNYKGLFILEKLNNTWQFRNKIEGFNISSRYFEFIDLNELFVSHEHKGVYKIKIDKDYQKIIDYKKMSINEGIKSSIVNYNDEILYSSREGVFKFKNNSFKKDTVLSKLLSGDKYVSGKLIYDKKGDKLWGFSNNEIIYVEPGKLSSKPKVNVIAISSEVRKSKPAFENILLLRDNNYLIGTTEGYLIMDLNKIAHQPLEIHLNNIKYGALPNELQPLNLVNEAMLKNKFNNLKFNYSIANYEKLLSSKYKYRLKGIYNDWSDWSRNSEVFFKNLPHGDYTFEAKAMSGGILSDKVLSYSFNIEKPWYIKPLAIVLYVGFGLFLMYLLHFFNKRHYKKQQQKLLEKKERELKLDQLENQRQLIQFKNKNLQLDIENKNRELGMATMNLVKRNELLNNIKTELSKSNSVNDIKKVVKLINSSLNNTGDWKLFEEAFNNVDKDFMKKIKSKHPAITPNDLRLCAYLRLNLSSKEIAPLLNISHKSVEVKRYRLRKKIGLDHDQSLSNYIIEL
ncbi:LuxR family transcriptional regulator [Winogradskyella echinorum]|uniref:LuxR family transcriptional regulator n=2 Tax=Winogradskyella echinorum TaxID=538189 RepID=A0ABR6Y3Z6_9FLAO|nr:LuxR family transcriptional regulator [Winogradskyella echinorum]MBC5751742.1 LuxR family transcriptional regulator [Winogradskyella echinorum]